MNFFDKESNIIEWMQGTSIKDVCFTFSTISCFLFYLSIRLPILYQYWIDNSGEIKAPPDFYSDKYRFMLEVMRVDDYKLGGKSPNALETKLVYELNLERKRNNLPTFDEDNIKLIVLPDMSKASINNYDVYVSNFSRIVKKHVDKINIYRSNHENYKLCFFIFDESTCYGEPFFLDEYEKKHAGDSMLVNLHLFWLDRNLIDVFIDADIEYVFWFAPFKNLPGNPRFPSLFLIDVKKYKKKFYSKTRQYSSASVKTLEKE